MEKLYYKMFVFFQGVSDWFGERISDETWEDIESHMNFQIEETMAQLGKTKIEVVHVIEGPIHRDNIPDDSDIGEGLDWLLEVKGFLNNGEAVEDISLWFKDFNEAYSVVSHFYNSVEPKVFYL